MIESEYLANLKIMKMKATEKDYFRKEKVLDRCKKKLRIVVKRLSFIRTKN